MTTGLGNCPCMSYQLRSIHSRRHTPPFKKFKREPYLAQAENRAITVLVAIEIANPFSHVTKRFNQIDDVLRCTQDTVSGHFGFFPAPWFTRQQLNDIGLGAAKAQRGKQYGICKYPLLDSLNLSWEVGR
jgi:hypothetical protein